MHPNAAAQPPRPLHDLSSRPFNCNCNRRCRDTGVGGHIVDTDVTGNPTLTAKAGTYQALRVVSSCSGSTTRTVVVNRDADHAVPASVDLPGRRVTDPIDVSTVNGASVESYNTPDHPQDISLHTAKEATDQGALQHSFAPHSVTLLTFTTHGAGCAG